ncbi:uncharacterized protein LOC118800232 [Colossoma macropomum]|uniref:uncharacterized protein LOC118800232 n=1 Tax=Colossoma macropomum TaxID=42526 RepID=UPI001864C1DD|nr:uncharacterized protein LOC118800232 [Colossoma macropomum]
MATPAKRPREDQETVSCYIHSVSPVKFSANSVEFFNAVLQTGREDFHDAVVFSPGKRHAFLQAARNGTPLCLKSVKKALSFKGTSDFDVIVNNRTDVSVTTVPFAARSPPSPHKTTLKEVMTMPAGRKVSLVEAIVLSLSPSVRTVNIRGTKREVRNCCISDGTAQMTLQLWERCVDTVQVLSSYAFTELSTRTFEGKLQLTTSINTTCSPIGDLDVPDNAGGSADPRLSSVTGPVHALEIRATMKCSLCGSRLDSFLPRNKFHRR